jgi:hypothetical protein
MPYPPVGEGIGSEGSEGKGREVVEVDDGSEARSSKDGAKMLPEAANQVSHQTASHGVVLVLRSTRTPSIDYS